MSSSSAFSQRPQPEREGNAPDKYAGDYGYYPHVLGIDVNEVLDNAKQEGARWKRGDAVMGQSFFPEGQRAIGFSYLHNQGRRQSASMDQSEPIEVHV